MSLTPEITKHLAHLVRIRLTEYECERLTRDMGSIVHFVDQLTQVDLSRLDTALLSSQTFPGMRMMEDEVKDQMGAELILDQAPQQACNMFVVPKMVE